ncbi:galactosylgalactosylxylosylprotein 3-beta-glucuronosyltransferase 2-like [Lampetra planeri]
MSHRASAMKAYVYSRFIIIAPWILVLVLVLDLNTERKLMIRHSKELLGPPDPHPPAVPPSPPPLSSSSSSSSSASSPAAIPVVYCITPTYSRAVQKAELTRLANTFRQVPRFHWLVVEDSGQKTALVGALLAGCGVAHTHLNVATPRRFKRAGQPRATEQRNEGLKWLRRNRAASRDRGVVFFADDDNTYSLELFHEIRSVHQVGVWPVGLVGGRRYERPLVERGRVVGWYTGWRPDRPFATDMAGFAVNLEVLLSHHMAVFKRRGSQPGMQESDFLKQITTMEELEPKADNCTKVLVWHTRTEKANLASEPKENRDSINPEV